MDNKLPKHDVHTLSDGKVVIYLTGRLSTLEHLRTLYDNYSGKAVAWVAATRNWDVFVEDFFRHNGLEFFREQGFWDYRDLPVYRGKLKTRIKQLEEEIKQEPVMDEETFKKLKPETEAVVNINGTYLVGEPADKFDKHSAETEKVYITGGHLEKPKETTKIFYNPGNSDQDLVHAFLLGMAFVTAILVIANLIS